jgi:hypothetical protein
VAPDSRESGAFYFGANGLGANGQRAGNGDRKPENGERRQETGERRQETGEGKTENQIFLFISNYFNLFKNKLFCID